MRWELSGPRREEYLSGHIPGAVFVDLDRDLSGPPGSRGRHPLPEPEAFAQAMRRAGVGLERPVVAYDGATSMAAARAWWLLRYFGHQAVCVLDGGLASWIAAGYPLESGEAPVRSGEFRATPGGMPVLSPDEAGELPKAGLLLDARSPERFLGQHEPIDPVAGHIPGAVNHPTTQNLDASGHFLAPSELKAAFERGGAHQGQAIGAYCGSGITAAHQVLALELAGLRAALYPGSWSEWVSDPARPVARGE